MSKFSCPSISSRALALLTVAVTAAAGQAHGQANSEDPALAPTVTGSATHAVFVSPGPPWVHIAGGPCPTCAQNTASGFLGKGDDKSLSANADAANSAGGTDASGQSQ
jgi:hypothetical protein